MIPLASLVDLVSGNLAIDPQNPATKVLAEAAREIMPANGSLTMRLLAPQTLVAAALPQEIEFQPELQRDGTAESVWGSRQTRVTLLLDDTRQQVLLILITRPLLVSSLPDVAGLSMDSAVEELQLESIDANNASSDWRRQRLIAAQVHAGDRTVEVRMVPRGNDELWLEADFVEPQPSLGHIAKLLGYASGAHHDIRTDLDWLPEELRTGGVMSVESLDAFVALEHPPAGGVKTRLQQISTTLNFVDGHRWQPIPGFAMLSVSHLQAHIEVDQPLDAAARHATVDLSGELIIKLPDNAQGAPQELSIHTQARWPDFALSAEMHPEDRISLGQLLQWLELPAAPGAAQHEHALEISRLRFSADLSEKPKEFRFSGQIDSHWPMTFPAGQVNLDRLGLDLDYHDSELDVSLVADLHIGNTPLSTMANRSAAGWSFAGRLGPDANMPLGHWLKSFAQEIADVEVPAAVVDFTLDYLELEFHTEHKDLSLTLDCSVDATVKAELKVNFVHQADDTHKVEWSGYLAAGVHRFDLHFDAAGGDRMMASYAGAGHDKLSLQDIASIAHVDLDASIDLAIELRSLLIARESTSASAVVAGQPPAAAPSALSLFAADIGAGLDLSALPLLGKLLPPGERLSLTLQIAAASAAIAQADQNTLIAPINALLPPETTPLPTEGDPVLKKGLNIAAKLALAGDPINLGLPITTDNSGAPIEAAGGNVTTPGPTPAAQDDGTHWVDLQKRFGPVQVERVGLRYAHSELAMLVDGALSAGPVSLSLDGLGVHSRLHPIEPHFELHGLGLDFSSGPVEIGGALLRTERTDPASGEKYDSFDGAAVLSAKALTLSALGSYAKLHGQPSLFIYAVLDYPIGGPAFFFVTGLAAGFGYNRGLRMPGIGTVAEFPLIKSAVSPQSAVKDVQGALEQLHEYVPIETGQYFLAVGVKFNSFKLIDSFAMLAVTFGHQFEVDVLGLSTLVVPSAEVASTITPLAELQLALKARFAPAEGLLSLEAQLTHASFILSRDCHLRGGFAFYSWFSGDRAGDFVVSLGGYHPHFTVPAGYPTPPRLGFSWQPVHAVQIKGDAYYALTGHALMAGGGLSATYHNGDLAAWFKAHADFLLNFAPYHYEASMSVHVGASYTVHFFGAHKISAEVGADLSLHGPEFAGHASVNLTVCHVDFDFGARSQAKKGKLSWSEFEEQFLPTAEQVCSLTLTEGVMASGNESRTDQPVVVNPRHCVVSITSQVPVSDAASTTVPVGPAAIVSLDSSLTLTLQISNNSEQVDNHFRVEPVFKQLPANLWGSSAGGDKPAADTKNSFVKCAVGYLLHPARQPTPGHTQNVPRSMFSFEPLRIDPPAPVGTAADVTTSTPAQARQQIEAMVGAGGPAGNWSATAAALGIDLQQRSIKPGVGLDLLDEPTLSARQ